MNNPPIKGMKKVPMGLPLMFDAFIGCVLWAASEPEARQSFTAATGYKLEALTKRNALDAMIDQATGYERETLAAFCDYVTTEIWGEEQTDLPPVSGKKDDGT